MNDNRIKWRTIDFWKYELGITVMGGMLVWLACLCIGDILAVYTASTFPIYLFFFIGVALFIYWGGMQIYRSKSVPTKVGYDKREVRYVERGFTRRIDFGEIERIDCSRSERGYIGIRKIDGTDVYLGPGCGGKYGRQLLELYSEWVSQELGKEAKIKEAKKLYHKIYIVDVQRNSVL